MADDSSEDGSSKEALDLWLGLDVSTLKEADWGVVPPDAAVAPPVEPEKNHDNQKPTLPKVVVVIDDDSTTDGPSPRLWKELLSRAYTVCPSTGALREPNVRIVDLSHLHKGFGLVATQRFEKGQVILTEKAAVATQIPRSTTPPTSTRDAAVPWRNDLFPVRACQQCFRSMEPISSLKSLCDDDSQKLPCPELWPFMEYETTTEQDATSTVDSHLRIHSKSGAVQCVQCHALFCNKYCHRNHEEQYGSCCLVKQAVRTVLDWCQSRLSGRFGNQDEPTNPEEGLTLVDQANALDQPDHDAPTPPVQVPLVLASRILGMLLHRYRSQNGDSDANILHCFEGLCGDSSDITPLEIGEQLQQDDEPEYSIESLHNLLCERLEMSVDEKSHFSCRFLQQLASVVTRNTHSVSTQNPFQPYYNALLRLVGRGSERHTALKLQVAKALGATNGELHRDMDHWVAERCCVQPLMGVFPLTARSNHSCQPNAMVRNQEYVDCCIDLVAQREIQLGEEITTSYIPTNLRRKHQRQLLLEAKYLFYCQCELCCASASL